MSTAGNHNGDGVAGIEAPVYYCKNYARTDIDHTHNLEIENTIELPFGSGKKFAVGASPTWRSAAGESMPY